MNSRRTGAVPTLQDVADAAGVSLTTASRSLHSSGRPVTPENRARVEAAAARLNYAPNLTARAMARGTTTTVALVVGDISDPYFSSISAGVVAEAESEDLIVTMSASGRNPRHEIELVRSLKAQRPRVIILAASRGNDRAADDELVNELNAYEDAGGRVVLIGRSDLPFKALEPQNLEGAEALARTLVGLGYRRFGVITDSEGLITGSDRVEGFRRGIESSGQALHLDWIVHETFDRSGGYSGAQRLLQLSAGKLDLIFACTDAMALGAQAAVRDAGLTPGVDVAIAGFDDIPNVTDVTPALTTVRVPLTEIGRQALRMALWRPDDERRRSAATEVVIRDSTPPRHAMTAS